MAYVFPAPAVPSVGVVGTDDRFPVRRIFCVGRNYSDHAREMGHDPDREKPFFFTKPGDALVDDGCSIPYPSATEDLHHEVELVVALGAGGVNITPETALDRIFGYGVGIDLTRRDLQAAAKSKGRPWDMAKGFDHSAVLGVLSPVECCGGHPVRGEIGLSVNGVKRQSGDVSAMIWPVRDIIAQLSQLVALMAGDLIYSGTPAGVSSLVPGDRCDAWIDGLQPVVVNIAP